MMKSHKSEQRFVLFPHGNIEKRVGADNEKNTVAVAVIGVAEIADRVYRVVQLRAGKIIASFGERRNKVRVLGAGQRNHCVAVRERREVLLQFVRWAAGGNEMDFVKIKTAVRRACDREMPVMDGIE